MTNFLSSPAFSLSYYLFTLLAIEFAFLTAFDQSRRGFVPLARRLAFGFGLLGVARLLLALLGGFIDGQAANHTAIIISIAFLAWSFSPYLINHVSLGLTFTVGSTILGLILFGLQANTAPDTIFNYAWLGLQIGLAFLSALSLWPALNQARLMAMISFVLLGIGSFGQLLVASQEIMIIRLAEMVAYPILTVSVYQLLLEAPGLTPSEPTTATQPSQAEIESVTHLFEATRDIIASLDVSQVLDGTAKGVVKAVQVDQCAIALLEEDEANQLRMVATYNPHREGRGEAVTFPVSQQPAIKHALERLREVEINSGYQSPNFQFLFAMMGVQGDAVGPLVIQPLILRNTAIGVLIAANAHSKQPFGATQIRLLRTMANQAAIAIDNARSYQLQATKSQQLAWTLRNQEQESNHQQAALKAELKKSREEVTIISQRLYDQDSISRKSQKQLTEYQQQAAQLNDQLKSAKSELSKLQLENQQISALTDAHKKQLDKMQAAETELTVLRNQVSDLEAKTSEVDKLQEDLRNAQERSQKLIHLLRQSHAKIQQLAGMPKSITSPQIAGDLENLSCGLLISDDKGIINRVNAAATQLFNRPAKELVGLNLSQIIADEKWQQTVNNLGASTESNLVLTSFMVDDKVIKASISPMLDPTNQQVSGKIVILYDSTEEFRSQQAKDEFVASLSQDLRTPMTSITGYIELLLTESVGIISDMQRKFLQRVKANIERMELMLRDLVGVTAIDAGQYDIKPIRLDIGEVIEDAIIGAKGQLEEKEILLQLSLPDEIPPVEADPDCIHQVMASLLGNAAKITPIGGEIDVQVTVTQGNGHIAESEETRWLQVSVTDSGGGIAEKDRARVFDRFYMAEQPLIQGLGETGVGFSIIKYLIEAHGGKIWLDSDIGIGSSFHFALLIKDYFNDPWQDLDVPPLDLDSDILDS